MNTFCQNCIEVCRTAFYRGYGLNLPKVYRYGRLFNKSIQFDKLEHLSLQRQQFAALNAPQTNEGWLSPESYFVDWTNSTRVQNLDKIEEILQQSLLDVESQNIQLVNQRFYQDFPMESQFVHRVLLRKIYEMEPRNPIDNENELFKRAINCLIGALEKDKIERASNPNAKLRFFTQSDYAVALIQKNCARTIVSQTVMCLALFIFMKVRKTASLKKFFHILPNKTLGA